MREEIKEKIFGVAVAILTFLLFYMIGLLGYNIGKDNIVQKLCEKQQYDFCEIKYAKTYYKLKELKDD